MQRSLWILREGIKKKLMKAIFIVLFIFMNTASDLFSQEIVAEDRTHLPKIIYKINPLSLFEFPQNLLIGVEKPLKKNFSFVQEIGAGYTESKYMKSITHLRGITEIRKYFPNMRKKRKSGLQNHYLALDFRYRYTWFTISQWAGYSCNSDSDCDYHKYVRFVIQNHRLSNHIKYGRQIKLPTRNLLLDYYVGIGWATVIGIIPANYEDFRIYNQNPRRSALLLSNQQKISLSITLGIRLGYAKFEK